MHGDRSARSLNSITTRRSIRSEVCTHRSRALNVTSNRYSPMLDNAARIATPTSTSASWERTARSAIRFEDGKSQFDRYRITTIVFRLWAHTPQWIAMHAIRVAQPVSSKHCRRTATRVTLRISSQPLVPTTFPVASPRIAPPVIASTLG